MALIIQIEKLVIGGNGLSRLADGKVVLVPYVLPGEEVEIRPIIKKKNYVEARAVKILQPSADRVDPPCPYFSQCGGCDFLHVRFAKQADLKNQILHEQLERSGLKQDSRSFLLPPLPAPKGFHYRQRIRLHVGKDGELGFHRCQSHEVIPISACLLARQQLNDVLGYLINKSPFAMLAGLATSVELLLSPAEELVVILMHLSRKQRPAERKLLEELAGGHCSIKNVIVTATGSGVADVLPGNKTGNEQPLLSFSHSLPNGESLRMTIEPGGFCQVNSDQNEKLIALVMEWAKLEIGCKVLDLFSGMGNFSLPLAWQAQSVVGMDLQRSAIRSAKRNAEINGIENSTFSQSSALEGAKSLAAGGEKFDIALLDPPRQGCAEVIPYLPKLGIGQVIYISCDPATLCRDLVLLEREGYVVEKMKMVDMFPQTHHLETIVSLRHPL
ncbi:MAG: 23S rRNA (uracil(1939)-C(5))-methyltransferase RlmD [Proteobacteria bacterium]|nr:23S rRNA (uracil(1939)-C(5))-methyltransferase RlmD [Pseudomonadota bacterium]MBU4295389.1 23S rRNA (uracil(1939)-C(5))-methyltransferase RlmD [Pseudomonadota bacterium]MCG2748907.1 23S rRNA (uracil(1939)-C(5))-methyltransferase RlmD [Desulfobulbaceae bacterium]